MEATLQRTKRAERSTACEKADLRPQDGSLSDERMPNPVTSEGAGRSAGTPETFAYAPLLGSTISRAQFDKVIEGAYAHDLKREAERQAPLIAEARKDAVKDLLELREEGIKVTESLLKNLSDMGMSAEGVKAGLAFISATVEINDKMDHVRRKLGLAEGATQDQVWAANKFIERLGSFLERTDRWDLDKLPKYLAAMRNSAIENGYSRLPNEIRIDLSLFGQQQIPRSFLQKLLNKPPGAKCDLAKPLCGLIPHVVRCAQEVGLVVALWEVKTYGYMRFHLPDTLPDQACMRFGEEVLKVRWRSDRDKMGDAPSIVRGNR